ncbi:D-inositol-3-phosphate glycosyltransferase [subsurface metagenome]
MTAVAMIAPWAVKCGIYTYTRDLSEALAEKGVDVYIVRLPRFGKITHAILGQVINKIPVSEVDLIHVQHEYGLYKNMDEAFYGGLKRLEKPIVSTMHAVGNLTIDRAIADASDRIIVHNQFCKKRLRFKSQVIHHGCKPSETVPREEAMKKLGIDERVPLVGYCGFISPYKGLESLIEAISKIPKSALLIGGGWHTESGTQYIANLNQMTQTLLPHRCKWLGFVPDEDLPMVYGAASLIVYPSIYSTESGALLMALSHGKAVVANRLPPFKEKEKLGALTTFRGVNSLVKKIRLLLRDDALRASLEEGAKAYALTNSWENVAEQHLELYEELLNPSE